jgi:hypothetical protein
MKCLLGKYFWDLTKGGSYTYKNFEVTEEPAEDPDPNAADSIAGIELPSPFGR